MESSDDDDDDVNDAFVQQQQILRDQETGAFGAGEPDDYDESEPFNLDSYASTPLSQWIGFEGPRRELKRQFGVFLTTFTESDDDAGIAYYREKINQMFVLLCVCGSCPATMTWLILHYCGGCGPQVHSKSAKLARQLCAFVTVHANSLHLAC